MTSQHGTDVMRRPPIRRALSVRVAAAAALLLVGAGSAPAAVIQATPVSSEINVGQQVIVDVAVQLGVGETASIFEADFALVGFGTIAAVALSPGGPTWPNAEGNVVGGVATVSLTSNNAGNTRRVGQLTVTGSHAGTLEVRLGQDTILQRDIPAEPFFANVPLTTATDTLLATINVVPEPASLALGGAAIAALASVQCRRARSRSSTATKFS